MTLGIALQLINIIRDVDEDRQLGRVYLPQDELAALRGRGARAVAAVPRADGVRGASGRGRTSPRGCACSTRSTGAARSASATFAGLYRETLDRIEANGFDVFGEKTRLSTPRKLAVVARGLLP